MLQLTQKICFGRSQPDPRTAAGQSIFPPSYICFRETQREREGPRRKYQGTGRLGLTGAEVRARGTEAPVLLPQPYEQAPQGTLTHGLESGHQAASGNSAPIGNGRY